MNVRFDANGLVPAVVTNGTTGAVLMLAYMNRESLDRTLATGETWFWSRSRQELWNKGATSGNRQAVRSIAVDCDGDTLLIEVDPAGPACHTGAETCFGEVVYRGLSAPAPGTADTVYRGLSEPAPEPFATQSSAVEQPKGGLGEPAVHRALDELEQTLVQRKRDMPEGSYSAYLFSRGTDKILKKIVEEATEVVIAAKGEGRERLVSETADLLYHLTALLVNEGIAVGEVMAELQRRSSLTPKASPAESGDEVDDPLAAGEAGASAPGEGAR